MDGKKLMLAPIRQQKLQYCTVAYENGNLTDLFDKENDSVIHVVTNRRDFHPTLLYSSP